MTTSGAAQTQKQKDDFNKKMRDAQELVQRTKKERFNKHYRTLVTARLTVLEELVRILPRHQQWYPSLVSDVRKYLAEAKVPLDFRGDPPVLILMDEPLLQTQVIDRSLSRLQEKYPERAEELMRAYHDLFAGKNFDSIFSEAFKTLEEIARSITGVKKFVFDRQYLSKYFGELHPSIQETIIKLAGHRGDEGGHGRAAPDGYEMRYLLFSICNIALLLLDYSESIEA